MPITRPRPGVIATAADRCSFVQLSSFTELSRKTWGGAAEPDRYCLHKSNVRRGGAGGADVESHYDANVGRPELRPSRQQGKVLYVTFLLVTTGRWALR